MTWLELEEEIKKLVSKIQHSPDCVVGIVRGGIIPARLLSKYLNVKSMYCISVTKIGDERKVSSEVTDDLSGKKILLVDDMLETGESLISVKSFLEKKGALVKTACLYTMPISKVNPDFSLGEMGKVVKFPWE